MARMFNVRLLLILNALTFILSVCVVGFYLYLRYGGDATECGRFLQIPLLASAGFIMFLSAVGLAGGCFRNSCLMVVYLVLTGVLIVVLACLTLFVFILANQGGAGKVASKSWLEKRVENYETWKGIKSCLQGSNVCGGVYPRQHQVSPIQSGCCQSPPDCNNTLNYVTNMKRPTLLFASSPSSGVLSDCSSWDEDESILCYNCQSCKAGFTDTLKNRWKKIAIANAAILGFLVIILVVGCCAISSMRTKPAPSQPSA